MAAVVLNLCREASLGEGIAVPWHYTTVVDFIDHWQTLLAGLIALIAAVITVAVTLNVERRKVDRELDVAKVTGDRASPAHSRRARRAWFPHKTRRQRSRTNHRQNAGKFFANARSDYLSS